MHIAFLRALPLMLVPLLLAGCHASPGGYVRDSREAAAQMAPPESLPPDDRATYLALIARMQDQGAWFASLAHIEAFKKQYGATPELQIMSARALQNTGQSDAARSLYQSLTSSTQAAAAWHGLGLVQAASGEYPQAQRALLKATQLAPLNSTYLGDLGFAYLRTGQIEDARAPLGQAAELAPGDARAIANLALWSLLARNPAQAESIMQQAGLPQATREQILRLSREMPRERDQASSRILPPAGHQLPASPEADVRVDPSGLTSAPANSTPPRTMLQRFAERPGSATPPRTAQ